MKSILIVMAMTYAAPITLRPEASRAQDGERQRNRPATASPSRDRTPDQEPDFAITPNTIRIQSLASPKTGSWVVVPGFRELGSPCFSRDGDWIAFDGYREGFDNSPAESWIARRDGRDLTRLAEGSTPRWSPDGHQLLFVRTHLNHPGSDKGIFLINRDGSNERRIAEGRWPDWSPDGKQIVYSLGGDETGGARIGATIYIANLDGSGRRKITRGDCPSWSPDGKKIAVCFRVSERRPVIRVHDLRSEKEETLGIGWYRANWMPDSKSVVANGAIGRNVGMVRLSLESPGRPIDLRTEFAEPSSPCCSWDGQQIVFIARRSREPQ